ncbi:hypothetical protein T3H97_10835 [Paenibacillus sp. LX16]|uniref:hypothetical protein n=1 Tax=Paenibacillus sp. LX16 TaxID=1740264 RepID=UPI002E2C1C6B|nr:hypothetical protein [Paenibacillus sp. LX16]
MLMRKVMICTNLFILLLVVGWRLEYNIHEKTVKSNQKFQQMKVTNSVQPFLLNLF